MRSGQMVRSTREQIADQLRDDVLTGRLEVGARLSEAHEAERFGVSRGPIREAITQLTTEGLFVAKQNCGVTVAPPAPEPIRELILPIRATLEVYALKQYFADLRPADFREWDELLFRMERACQQGDAHIFPQLDVALHRSIIERADQPDLLAIWQSIVNRMRAHFWQTTRRAAEQGEMPRLHRHHVQLIDAFRSGDVDLAVSTLTAHIGEN
jgi:DNA-binding GntR family transcriptional regulator